MYNPYLVVPIAAWAITQLAKFALAAFRGNLDFRYLYASGGMPSVHAAVVTSLAVTAWLVDGSGSHIFGLTVILAAIVMYDSFGVRRSSGEQAVALNMIIGSLNSDRVPLGRPDIHLREILGHKPREVSVGAVIGTALGLLFNYNHLTGLGNRLSAVPGHAETFGYLVIYAVVAILGLGFWVAYVPRRRTSAAWRRLLRGVWYVAITTLILGALAGVSVLEKAAVVGQRWFPLLVLAIIAVAVAWLITWAFKTLPPLMASEVTQARKDRWLQPSRKRSKRKR